MAARPLSMPPEWAPHERTLMAWPCRASLWGPHMEAARRESAGVANAIAAFEPVTMVCASLADVDEARAQLDGHIEVIERPIDDSWLRDSGPVFVTDGASRRAGVCFGFNAWGEKFTPYDADARIGELLVRHLHDEVVTAPFVLEGGSIAVDGAGTLLTTEQCLLDPNRNPQLSREEIEQGLKDFLGVQRVVWLGRGLAEDKDTDGHVDLICVPFAPGKVLLQTGLPGTADEEAMEDNAARCAAADVEPIAFAPMAHGEVAGERTMLSYLNLYLCNGGAIVPLAGTREDEEALDRLAEVLDPEIELVGVPALTIAWGGGGPHCITQQVPRRASPRNP